jgi:hypothetical protein
VLTSENHEKVRIFDTRDAGAAFRDITLSQAVSDVCPAPKRVFLAGEDGLFVWLDPNSGETTNEWNARKSLDPPGHKGESVVWYEPKSLALASFQKDGKKGRQGSRVLVFDPRTSAPLHDLRLPRDRPDLHIEGSEKEQGPNPELIFTSERSNTLLITLDLYGALAFADLDAALEGKLENYETLSTAMDESWGSAFPDRALLFERGGKDWILISNASAEGGLVLFDVAERKRLAAFPAPAGAEHPVELRRAGLVATVVSGKAKARAEEGKLSKEIGARPLLLLIDIKALDEGGEPVMREVPLEEICTGIRVVTGPDKEWLLLAGADGQMRVMDPLSGEIVARMAGPGTPVRFARCER